MTVLYPHIQTAVFCHQRSSRSERAHYPASCHIGSNAIHRNCWPPSLQGLRATQSTHQQGTTIHLILIDDLGYLEPTQVAPWLFPHQHHNLVCCLNVS